MGKIFSAIFPMLSNYKANKKLTAKIHPKDESGENVESINVLTHVENADTINIDILAKQYDDTFKVKDKFEDKAKSNIIGITVSITLIVGASGILSSITEKFPSSFISLFLLVMFIISVVYMLIAGILVIRVLTGENETYVVKLNNLACGGEALRKDYGECIAYNQVKNTIRNNYVFSSYACMRNSLICLFIVFLFIAIPFNQLDEHTNNVLTNSSQEYSFYFSSSAIDYIKVRDVRDIVENTVVKTIEKYEQKGHTETFGVIATDSNLFIKYEVLGNDIRIMLIESYITP